MDNNFKDVDFNTPIKDASDIQTCVLKPSLNAFITHKELTQLDVLLTKKGNCSTNDAGTRIAYGDVYNSHALTFYLYNFSALKIIDRFITDKQECSILELGCNNGHVSRLFQRNNFKFKEYWGIDFDFSFIIEGIDSFTDKDILFPSNFCSGNFNEPLNFKDDSFGLVYFQEAFDHCRDKLFFAEQCISEIKRVLKNYGYLYITLVFDHDDRDLYHWDHNYTWNKFEFENMIQDYFKIVNFTPLLTFEKTIKKTFDPQIQKVKENWPNKFAKMMCAQFVDESDTAVGSYLLQKVSY
jgi:SAM-dependent methyltransferase